MQKMFGVELLARCIGTNAIFVRAPSVEKYMAEFRAAHHNIARFCTAEINTLIEVVKPKRIVTIGLSTLSLFGPAETDLKSRRGRALTKVGKIAGYDALAVLHLTGARISSADRELIAARVLEFRSCREPAS